jgi:hypothetical protein
MRPDFQCDPTARHRAENLLQRFPIRANSLFQLYLTCLIDDAIPAVAIAQIQSDGQLLGEIFLLCFATAVLTFFIAGLLNICASSTLITWERIASRRRPVFSSHLVS